MANKTLTVQYLITALHFWCDAIIYRTLYLKAKLALLLTSITTH